jgi:two-component system phosphate regulon response regulator PhoB
VFRFRDLAELRSALDGSDHELPLPGPEPVADGEWVLAIFEVGEGRRATASAARAIDREGHKVLAFEKRDWHRIHAFVGPPGSVAAPSTVPETVHQVSPASLVAPSTSPAGDGADQDRPVESEAIAIPLVRHAAPESLSAPDTVRAPPAQKKPSLGQTGARVLVVDDDAEVRDVVGAMLEAVGLVVLGVGSAEDALASMATEPFDMLVVDWGLPGVDGLELCRRVRHDQATSTLPVLFLSARSATTDVVEAFGAGADDFVMKPFRAAELGARIFALLRRARMRTGAVDE